MTSQKRPPKGAKTGKMNENSAIFTLTGIKIHARTYRSDDFSTHFICFPNYFFIFAKDKLHLSIRFNT